ncbi:MAG TPA: hypothetical protein VGF99_03725, partial [Myxococcota bacterium]
LAAVVACVVAVGGGGGCTSADDAPVAAFEDFYAATANRDIAGVRAGLCPQERRLLETASDDVLLQAFAVVKVVKRVTLESRSDAAAVVVVEDAVAQTTRVQLRHDINARRGWCVSGPLDDTKDEAKDDVKDDAKDDVKDDVKDEATKAAAPEAP